MVTKIHKVLLVIFISAILIAMCSPSTTVTSEDKKQLVRLAVIEVDTGQIKPYKELLREEIDASIRMEPGVITLYGVAEKENSERVTLFETYADSSHYKSHLETPHFQKYKQGTIRMVTNLELIQMRPILYHRKANFANAQTGKFYIRLIKMEIDTNKIEDFNKLAKNVMLPGIKTEPGVLIMYAVAEKNRPKQISILEVYENLGAYNAHISSSHFLKYKQESKTLVTSLKMIEVDPILLGSKIQ